MCQDNIIDTYMDAVIGYIGKCINGVVLRITVHAFPNQKPWIDGEVHVRFKLTTRVQYFMSYVLECHCQ